MHPTRRQFVGTAAALAALSGTGLAVRAAAGPVRLSLIAFSQDDGRVASLRKGVAAMKALPGSDHRSWFYWAATHAYSSALLAAEVRRDPKLKHFAKDKYWNQCPHFGQCSADFVIWHRAYLHFFERTLRQAAGDPTLALPYWDYSKADARIFPAIFAPEFLDPAKAQPNSLFHPNREKSFVKGTLEISGTIGEAAKTVAAATFFHQVGVPGFGGDTLDSDNTQIGLLEQRPHNDIHSAVGGAIGTTNGAMAEITTAAFDPVFWVHHANVDRLWAEWASRSGKDWGPAPSPGWFDETPWLFVDADGSDVRVSRREAVVLLADYDVDYAGQLAPPPRAVMAAAPSGGGNGAPAAPMSIAPARAAAAPPRHPRSRELLADSTPITVTPHNSAARPLGAAAARRDALSYDSDSAPANALAAPELADGTSRVLLELSGIRFTVVPSSGFAVYLDCAGRPPSAEPVGLLDIFGATHHGAGMAGMPGMGKGASQRFDVTATVRRSRGPYTLRVEPYDLLVTHDGKSTRGRADAVTIGAVRFVVVS